MPELEKNAIFVTVDKRSCSYYILWHVDRLLDNDRQTSNYTTATAKKWQCK
jgi:hypothetical protein